jgi:hypothetical protein
MIGSGLVEGRLLRFTPSSQPRGNVGRWQWFHSWLSLSLEIFLPGPWTRRISSYTPVSFFNFIPHLAEMVAIFVLPAFLPIQDHRIDPGQQFLFPANTV